MKKLFLPLLFTVSCSLFNTISYSQDQKKIDSLKNELRKFEVTKKELGTKTPKLFDTVKVNLLELLAYQYFGINADTAMEYGTQALSICEKNNINHFTPNYIIGRAYEIKADFNHALEYYQNALTESEKLKDTNRIAGCYFDMGNVYQSQSNYPLAIRNELDALKMFENLGDTIHVGIAYSSLGKIYSNAHNYPEALKNHLLALQIFSAKGLKEFSGTTLNNIGLVYSDQNNFQNALKYFRYAQKMFKELGNKFYEGKTICNIGEVYRKEGNYAEALTNFLDAKKIFEEVGAKDNIAIVSAGLGKTYLKLGKFQEANKYANNALTLSLESGDKDQQKEAYKNLAEVNAAMRNYKAAYEYAVLYKQTYDSIFNKENEKKITSMQMTYDFDKRQDSTKAEQVKKDAVSLEVIKRQRQLKNAFIIGFILVVLLAMILYNRFRIKRNANVALEEKNRIINHEKERSDQLLLNILPADVAEELKNKGKTEARNYEMVSVMFTDFKDFTMISEQLTPSQLVAEIDTCFSAFDNIIHKHGIEKIKTIGDAYMCAGGLPVKNSTHAEDTVRAALEIRDFMSNHNKQKRAKGEILFEIRIGINTGPVVAGIVGVKKFAYDIWGDTVNLAARMESSGVEGQVNVSGSTYQLVKDKFTCIHRGKIETKNKGEVDMYFVD